MINTTNTEEAKKLIKDAREEQRGPVIIKAQNDDFNRKILEYGHFDILLSPEAGNRKDSLRQQDSGFNHVLAKIAAKKRISLGIDLQEISLLSKKEKSIRLARIKQNIEICRKTGTKLKILNAPDKRVAYSLLLVLGASSQQAKEAITFLN